MWVAKDVENKILGFITLSETSKDTVEIHCMAVKSGIIAKVSASY